MKRKDTTVQTEFHPILTAFLFEVDELYRVWGAEAVVTSGSEPSTRHGTNSLHYAVPACAADIRDWEIKHVPTKESQKAALIALAEDFSLRTDIPVGWIEIVLEPTHIHIEFQPKRQLALTQGN